MKAWHVILIVVGVLLIDQSVKIGIKTSMHLYDVHQIFGLSWAEIAFQENEGMAFSMSLGGESGKYILTTFRLVAAGFLGYLLSLLLGKKARKGFIICVALILAGALGNILDSLFYGVMFSESTQTQVATMFPPDGGYAGLMQGKVVDMFHFPFFTVDLPEWLPLIGGEFTFFDPIFNVADSSIFIGITAILLFFRKDLMNFQESLKKKDDSEEEMVKELQETK